MEELPDQVRRRLDEVFGDVLPAVSQDEAARDEVSDAPEGTPDDELLADRPPHHDRE